MNLALGHSPRANVAPRRDPRLPLDATHLPRLLDDLDAAMTDLLEPLDAHYTFPEAVRVHAVHARHHARQLAAIAAVT